jgi:glutamate racemase
MLLRYPSACEDEGIRPRSGGLKESGWLNGSNSVLGFFDSGFGGLSVVREIEKTLPPYSFIYLGDNARSPYGSRPLDVIHQYTLEGIIELFRSGAELIVVACNTSSSVALRKIQQEYLPAHYPDRRVLGIVIPTAEEVSALSTTKVIGILATEATVNSLAYVQEIEKIDARVVVHQEACPLLVPIIEAGDLAAVSDPAQHYIQELLSKDTRIDTILLGCTHYALIEDILRSLVPSSIRIVTQGRIVAAKLADYLRRHPEMEKRLEKSGKEIFLTTEYSPRIQKLATQFFGRPIKIETRQLHGLT